MAIYCRGSEVDFVLYGESGMYAIEVKNRRAPRAVDFTGLRAFYNDHTGAS